jgi:alkanesulfonate monooxygenase SsuD/methylene tetrahydromethanopterin reductase-like flavin-dependent oxidoreductase (luciferase family)
VEGMRAAEAFVGSPDQVVDRIGRFAETGASRMYLQYNGLADLDHLDLVASQVAPQLGLSLG